MSFNVIFIKSIYGRESFEIIFREGGGLVRKKIALRFIITVKLKGNFIFKSRKTFIYKIFKYKTKLLIFFIIEDSSSIVIGFAGGIVGITIFLNIFIFYFTIKFKRNKSDKGEFLTFNK